MSNNGIPPLNDWQADNYPVIYDEGDSTTKYVKDGNKVAISGGGVESVTYAELVALIGSSGLTVGGQYLVTDFATKHYIVDGNDDKPAGNPIITGVTEPLIVTAVAVNKVDKVAKSTLYPQDIIYVDFDSANWTDDISFSDSGVIVSGWKGTIYFRHDTLQDNYTPYDFRNVKFRRWKTAVAAWSGATTYAKGEFAVQGNIIYLSLIDANLNNTPVLASDHWSHLLDLTKTEYYNNNPTSTNGIPSDTVFDDFKTFSEGAASATYALCCYSNHIEGFKDNETYDDTHATILCNNVCFLQDGDYYQIFRNKISYGSFGNTIGASFIDNNIDQLFTHNQFGGNFYFNIVGANFTRNCVGKTVNANTFDPNNNSNYYGAAFNDNKTGANFTGNLIGYSCFRNTFGISTQRNVMKQGFQMNATAHNSIQDVDFTSSTHVYGLYNCELFKRQDGTARLRYTDNSDVDTIVAAAA